MPSSAPLEGFQPGGDHRYLTVLLHSYEAGAGRLEHLIRTVADALPNSDIYTPELPASRFSWADPNQIASGIADDIDRLWRLRLASPDGKPYKAILLAGHSLGALLVRKAYIIACGENPDAPFEAAIQNTSGRAWAGAVRRIVLLAGMNRGWSLSHHLSLPLLVQWWLGTILGNLLMLFRRNRLLIFSMRRGAPFITQLRIQWLSMCRHAPSKGTGEALTVQILGSVDDMVSPEDSIDLVTGGNFAYLDCRASGHRNIVDMDDTAEGRRRRQVFLCALTRSPRTVRAAGILPADTVLPHPRKEVTDVVFVIHGIRDQGYWTHKIARRVKTIGRTAGMKFETETSTYGYFPMLPFIRPTKRRSKVEWLMDKYTEALATYPNANYSFVGHSNGTYLLAKALDDYPAVHFKNVVFAGSVVRTRYDWTPLLRAGRIKGVLNYVATRDWVVALFPKTMELLHVQDLGSAGHDGFTMPNGNGFSQIRYVRGAHSAALNEENWDAIAHFVVHGEVQIPPSDISSDRRSMLLPLCGGLAPLAWIGILAVLAFAAIGILGTAWDEWAKTLAILGLAWAVWMVLTRV